MANIKNYNYYTGEKHNLYLMTSKKLFYVRFIITLAVIILFFDIYVQQNVPRLWFRLNAQDNLLLLIHSILTKYFSVLYEAPIHSNYFIS